MFVDDIKSGLKQFLTAQGIDVNVTDLYIYGHEIKAPEIQIGLIDDSTYEPAQTFMRETLRNMPIQIVVYSGQLKINGDKFTNYKACEHITDFVREWIEANKTKLGVGIIVRQSITNTMPLNSGANIYYKVMRYRIVA